MAGLDARDAEPGACEQQARGQPGEAGTDDQGVQRLVGWWERVVRNRRRTVEPEGGHVSVAGPDGVAPASDSQPSSPPAWWAGSASESAGVRGLPARSVS